MGGRKLWKIAVDCARAAGITEVIVSSDAFTALGCTQRGVAFRPGGEGEPRWVDVTAEQPDYHVWCVPRPPELAADDTAMLAVVRHLLEWMPGQPDDIIVLLQPTQPFRTPERVREAITLLETSGADSVVSVVPLPLTHGALYQCHVDDGRLVADLTWNAVSIRRQDSEQKYIRDGTVYAFRRQTVTQHGNIYGQDCRPLILDPSETCELDTEAEWAEVERRWEARTHAG